MHAYVRTLTIDARGAIWGIYRWRGIHEESSAALVVSLDTGSTWSRIELDPAVCMPETFLRAQGEEALLLADDGQMWQHTAGKEETFTRWSRLGLPNPSASSAAGVALGRAIYVGGAQLSIDRGTSWKSMSIEPNVVALVREVDDAGKPRPTLAPRARRPHVDRRSRRVRRPRAGTAWGRGEAMLVRARVPSPLLSSAGADEWFSLSCGIPRSAANAGA